MTEEEPGFVTAAELRDAERTERAGGDPDESARTDGPSFAIPERPVRRYPREGGVEYVGGTVFSLGPADPVGDDRLAELVRSVLDSGPYRWGDWLDLPMPLYLVHDDDTHDTFRVGVRDGRVDLHVLPETDPAGLAALYERLTAASEVEWTVDRQVDDPV